MMAHKRIVIYIPDEDHKKLKSKLALLGESISGWLRKVIAGYLKQ